MSSTRRRCRFGRRSTEGFEEQTSGKRILGNSLPIRNFWREMNPLIRDVQTNAEAWDAKHQWREMSDGGYDDHHNFRPLAFLLPQSSYEPPPAAPPRGAFVFKTFHPQKLHPQDMSPYRSCTWYPRNLLSYRSYIPKNFCPTKRLNFERK